MQPPLIVPDDADAPSAALDVTGATSPATAGAVEDKSSSP
jgi:hypothetical protein